MLSLLLTVHGESFPLVFAVFAAGELSHADPVVPILIASIFITLGAALGGLLMKWLKSTPPFSLIPLTVATAAVR